MFTRHKLFSIKLTSIKPTGFKIVHTPFSLTTSLSNQICEKPGWTSLTASPTSNPICWQPAASKTDCMQCSCLLVRTDSETAKRGRSTCSATLQTTSVTQLQTDFRRDCCWLDCSQRFRHTKLSTNTLQARNSWLMAIDHSWVTIARTSSCCVGLKSEGNWRSSGSTTSVTRHLTTLWTSHWEY